jgi:helicase required for RNAi-mediated heterochromatin assembly 1
MLSLQKMASEKFPLSKHIVGVDDLVPPPRYIADRPELNLSAVYDSDIEARYVNINVLNGWPSGAKTTLDASQEKALQHVFRRRLAVIQGPPGTGKTHVSVMALKVLVENMAPTDPPIVVSCQTNHALDQLLRHIAKFEDRFIRLGGRSKDQGVVKEHTLYNVCLYQELNLCLANHNEVRQKVRFKAPGGMQASARNSLRNLEDEMRDLLAPLEYGKDHTSTGFMSLDTYRKAGILTEKQCKTLERGDDEWAGAPSNIKSPIAQWLGNCLQHNKRSFKPDDLGFDFEEVDLEFEQLKELEAENVCQDDDNDFESLPGNALSLFLAIVGKHSDVGEEKIETWLQNDNLWKIPTRHRGAVFNHIQRKAIQVKNERVRQLTAIYNRHAIRHRYGGFENNAILLRQQRIIGGKSNSVNQSIWHLLTLR